MTYYSAKHSRKIVNLPTERSHRFSEFLERKKISQKRLAIKIVLCLLSLVLIYFFIYSPSFRYINLEISGNTNIPSSELEAKSWQYLGGFKWLIIPKNNTLFFNKNKLASNLNSNYSLESLEINSVNRQTLNLKLKEKVGQLIWVSQNKNYLLDLSGNITSEIQLASDSKLPLIYDQTNSSVNIRDQVVPLKIISLIQSIATNDLPYFGLKQLHLEHFKIDGPGASFIKVKTKEGPELHLGTNLVLEQQLNKLKASLESNKITELGNISYINLRVEDQVIYK